ncbi:MAG: [protein-PII] uridylyltransferase [Desulfobacterales bacterium]|nr:MAG: [protein-PII] uridylyltransferase [Desulfobacterales bacterium]
MSARRKDPETPLERMLRQKEQLVKRFLKGNEPKFQQRHTRIMDEYFRNAYAASRTGMSFITGGKPCAIIAQGGYGREEQCIFSDVDLLILFDGEVPAEAEALVQDIVYPLWDIGLHVGHATRNVSTCIEVADENLEALTALLDARFICGQSFLYSRLTGAMRTAFGRRQANAVIHRLTEANQARHAHFGDATFLLEPNLKEGRGGLRDYHTLLWIARIRDDLRQPRDLEFSGRLSHSEYQELEHSLSFIWKVRNRLHHLARRKSDQLYFQHQETLAEAMNFKARKGQQPVERFLGCLHRHMTFVRDLLQLHLYELEYERPSGRGRKKIPARPAVEGIEMKNGMLGFSSAAAIPGNRALLLHIFAESARTGVPVGTEARRLIKDFAHLINREFASSKTARKAFETVLLLPALEHNVLDAMLQTGILVRFLPKFDKIVDRIQYDAYHIHPVDKHLLLTVRIIKCFGTEIDPAGGSLCGRLMKDLKDPLPLLWAALMHDIGKGGSSGNHSETGAMMSRRIMTEKGYDADTVDTVRFLVREHLFLIRMATRRDIRDEETALHCARRIRTAGRLKLLYLLTVADCIATGPKAWNEWTATLLENLFLNVLHFIEGDELTTSESMAIIDNRKAALLQRAGGKEARQEAGRLLPLMSPRYMLYTREEDIRRHVELYRRMGDRPFVWRIDPSPESGETRVITLCARDYPGLFSQVAGVFTLNGIHIRGAQVYTWRNNIALDILEVAPPPDRLFEAEKWDRTEADLLAVMNGGKDLDGEMARKLAGGRKSRPPVSAPSCRVVVDNRASSFFTIIEVFTNDRPGRLYQLTSTLFRCQLDVWLAKIATQVDQVVDIFYVRDFDGQKIDGEHQEKAVQTAIIKAMDQADLLSGAA